MVLLAPAVVLTQVPVVGLVMMLRVVLLVPGVVIPVVLRIVRLVAQVLLRVVLAVPAVGATEDQNARTLQSKYRCAEPRQY